MSLHTFECKQFLPIDITQAWDFFSSPGNLGKITPPEMQFEVLSGFREGERMYAGMIIEYRVRPLPGFTTRWVTEITHVNEPYYFVDEQRQGPYVLWHHRHLFKEVPGGIEMHDIVCYRAPMGMLGDVLNRFMIRKKIEGIFSHRRAVLDKLFIKQEQKARTTTIG